MTYKHPLHPHEFEYFIEPDLDGCGFVELNHLAYVDRVMTAPQHRGKVDVATLELMTDEQLRSMLTTAKPPRLKPERATPARVRIDPSIPRYRAALWVNGQSVHLGYYGSKEARDQAVTEAKQRRDIGLPVL